MEVININRNQFEEMVHSGKTVLVEFSAPWCVYCRRLAPSLESVAEEYKDTLVFTAVNIDDRRNSRTRGRGCHPAAFRAVRAVHRGADVCAVCGAAPASCPGLRPCGAAGTATGSGRRMLPGEPAGGERTRPDGSGHPGRACAAPGAGSIAGRRHPRRISQRKTGATGCGAENYSVLTSGLCCGSIILLL